MKKPTLGIMELLYSRGLDKNARIKLVRHQDKRCDIQNLDREIVEIYQRYQSKPVFNSEFIVSFRGLENSRALLLGVYRVGQRHPGSEHPVPLHVAHLTFLQPADYFYELEAIEGFEDLQERAIIHWGTAALAWHQWLNESDKEVVEIRPAGHMRPFPGYLEIVLSFRELERLVKNPAGGREWHQMLSAVAGVYLIVDGLTGKQYVGSASGERGILGRWEAYVFNGHGGNKQLVDLVGASSEYARNYFTFTVLHPLSRSLTLTEVVKYESLYKRKLGSKAFGLNSN